MTVVSLQFDEFGDQIDNYYFDMNEGNCKWDDDDDDDLRYNDEYRLGDCTDSGFKSSKRSPDTEINQYAVSPDETLFPSADWEETPEAHVIMVDLPGIQMKDLNVAVDCDRVLWIKGERKREEGIWLGEERRRMERPFQTFCRKFRLNCDVNEGSVKTKLENGVLSLFLPKLSSGEMKPPKLVHIVGARRLMWLR